MELLWKKAVIGKLFQIALPILSAAPFLHCYCSFELAFLLTEASDSSMDHSVGNELGTLNVATTSAPILCSTRPQYNFIIILIDDQETLNTIYKFNKYSVQSFLKIWFI